jgi:uncharacterized RDD family membrane protein YckC
MTEQQYYVMTKGTNQPVGPMNEAEIRQWISQRFLTNEDKITRAGDANWISVNQSPFASLVKTGSYPSVNQHLAKPEIYAQNFDAKPQPDSSILLIRWVALFIDAMIAIPLIILAVLPLISLIGTPLVVAYFISRDVLMGNGQSIGKRVMGLRVVKSDGTPVTWADSVRRNIVFFAYLSLFVFTVPYLGWIVALFLMIPVKIAFIVETILVLTGGRRMGDLMGTTYVARAY